MFDRILQYRIPVLIVLIVASIPFALFIPKMTRDAGISSLVPESHPAYKLSSRMEDLFGASDQIVIGINSERGIYTPDAIRLIYELTEFYKNRSDIDPDDIISLTTVDHMVGRDGELVIEPVIKVDDPADINYSMMAKIRAKIRSNPLFNGKLVSNDEKSAVVLVGVSTDIGLNETAIEKLKTDSLKELDDLKARFPDINLDFSGPAMLKAYLTEYMQKDLQTLFPLAIISVGIIILIILRSVVGMLMPVLVTLFSVVWTFGLKAMVGSPLTIVETAIPVVLIAIGCADGIHIVSDFLATRKKGVPVRQAVLHTMDILTLPVILTSVTTGLGFISLLTAPGVSIRNMGIFLAFGVMVAMVFSLFLIPCLISFFRPVKQPVSSIAEDPHTEGTQYPHAFERVAYRFAEWLIAHKYKVSVVSMVILAISIFGIAMTNVESDEVRYLKPTNEFRMATEHIQKNLGGITSLDIIIEGQKTDFLKQPKVLKAMESLQQFCEEDDLVSYSLSLVDLIKRLNYVLHDDDPAYNRLPNEMETVKTTDASGKTQTAEVSGYRQIAQYLLLYEMSGGESLEQYVDTEYKIGKISVRLKDMSSQRLERLIREIKPFVKDHFPKGTKVEYTNHYMRVVMMNLIIQSQIYSLFTVLVTIFLLMSIIFRSPVIGLFTTLPVLIAVLFNFAIMWAFNVTLNIGTSIIASVGMGVGIDYAIHYFTRFRLFLKQGIAYTDSAIKAIAETSRAILTNAAAVGLGFLVMLFSEYGVIANIGWITAVSMFTTAIGSLVVLPALLVIFKPRVSTSFSIKKNNKQ